MAAACQTCRLQVSKNALFAIESAAVEDANGAVPLARDYNFDMPLASDRCICLRKFEYSETSQILTLLSSEHGLLRVMAKGAHRRTKAGSSKFDGGVDVLDIGQAVFTSDTHRDLSTLTEWKLLEGTLTLRQTLRGLYLGLYAAELITMLLEEHDPHPQIFELTERLLVDLATPRREEAFLAFELDLLREGGFLPQLQLCVACGSRPSDREVIYFSPARGGLICRNCESLEPDRLEIDPRLVRLLRQIQALPASGPNRRVPQLTRHQTDPLNAVLAQHLQHALGRRMRLPRYVLARRRDPASQPSTAKPAEPAPKIPGG